MTAKYVDSSSSHGDKSRFLAELRQRLSVLPEAESQTALAYYDEYLSEAGPENEAAALAELGSPAQVAAGILGDHVYASTTGEEKSAKKGLSALWVVTIGILGVLAAPLAIPLIISIFGLLASALMFIFSLFLAAILAFVAGIIYIGVGFAALFSHFATGIATIGSGLALTALSAALALALAWLSKHLLNAAARAGSHMLRKLQTKKGAH